MTTRFFNDVVPSPTEADILAQLPALAAVSPAPADAGWGVSWLVQLPSLAGWLETPSC